MPKIPLSNRQQLGPKAVPVREATAEDFGAGSARALGQLGTEVGRLAQNLDKLKTNDDISVAQRELAKIRNNHTLAIRERARTSPLDENIIESLNEDLEAQFEESRALLKTNAGQNAFNNGSIILSSDLGARTVIAQSDRMGQKAKIDFADRVALDTATLETDPTQFESIRDQLELELKSGTGRFGQISVVEREELLNMAEKEMAIGQIRGLTNLSPKLAENKVKAGDFDQYLSSDEKKSILREISQSEDAERRDTERQRKEAERAQKQAHEVTRNEFLGGLNDRTLTKDIILKSGLPSFGEGSKQSFINLLDKDASTFKTDPIFFADLYQRTQLPADSPLAITEAKDVVKWTGKKLTTRDAHFLTSLIGDTQGLRNGTGKGPIQETKDEFLKQAKSNITKSTISFVDPLGDNMYYQFLIAFEGEFARRIKEGSDPMSLLIPTSKDYMGDTVTPFLKTANQRVKDMADGLRGEVTAPPIVQHPFTGEVMNMDVEQRGAKESPQDYLERMGKAK